MLEILFLLLPLAFYSGWRTANKRTQSSKKTGPAQQEQSSRFARGINYLLNEEPDKALDTFLEFPAIDAQTADTFLALGKLFRNRGEINRALRVHQHLVARPDLSSQQRQAAMLALGEDFAGAGLLDRAESVFRELLKNYPKNKQAREPLRHIYEQLQDWDKAIELADYASDRTGRNHLLTHYLCEQAEQLLEKNALYQADEKLKKAASIQANASRVDVLRAELALARGDRTLALTHFRQAIEADKRLLGSLGWRLLSVFDQTTELQQIQQFIMQAYSETQDVHLFPALAVIAGVTGQKQAVLPLVEHHLQHAPLTIQAVSRAADFLVDLPEQQQNTAQSLEILRIALARLLQTLPRFQCTYCGYKMHEYRWRCPACHQWDSIQHT